MQLDQEYIEKFRVFIILPEMLKNRLILLVIIWAKEELIIGNASQSLEICNIISYQLVYISNIFIINRNKNTIEIQKNNNKNKIITK
jgi:hypothetical protein